MDNGLIYDESNNRITINNLGSFEANAVNTTTSHKLSFIVPLVIDAIDSTKLNIDVIFIQEQL